MNDPKENLPKVKQTVLGLYVTAKKAYEKWQADPEKVMIIDVRTPEEYLFVGHPTMAWNIPVFAQSYEWDAAKQQFPMKPLPDFVARVQGVAKPDATLDSDDVMLALSQMTGIPASKLGQDERTRVRLRGKQQGVRH